MIWIQIILIFLGLQLISFAFVAKGENKIVLWPEYFDISLTKNNGRRVSRKLALNSPTVEDIAKAAKKLKLNAKIEHQTSYPSRWWRNSGRVLIRTSHKKTKVIRNIAIVMKKSRKK